MTDLEVTDWWRHELARDDVCIPEPQELIDADWQIGWE